MIFPLEITLRRKLPVLSFNYAPILEIIKRDLESKNVDVIEPLENGYAFRNNFLSFSRGKNHLMSGIMYGKFELENDTDSLILKYTYNMWVFFVIVLLFSTVIFSINFGDSFLWIVIPAFFAVQWLIILARHYFYLRSISKRIAKAHVNSI